MAATFTPNVVWDWRGRNIVKGSYTLRPPLSLSGDTLKKPVANKGIWV
jgi:hypothetical protein